MSFLQYCLEVLRRAFTVSLQKALAFASFLAVLGGALTYFLPDLESVIGVSTWLLPIAAFIGVAAIRIILAPYWIYRAEVDESEELRVSLTEATAERPRIVLSDVRDAYFMPKRLVYGGEAPKPIYGIAQAWFENVPNEKGESVEAQGLTAKIEFYGPSAEWFLFSVAGEWAESTSPAQVGFSATSQEINLRPGHNRVKLNIVIKHLQDYFCYPYSDEGLASDHENKNPKKKLVLPDYCVRVNLKGVRLDENYWFSLTNYSIGGKAELVPMESSFKSQASFRLLASLRLMNEAKKRNDRLDLPEIAEILQLDQVSEIEAYFTGSSDPPLQFLKDYADTFGISMEWLRDGKESPFFWSRPIRSTPSDYLDLVEKLSPSLIIFAKGDSIDADSCTALQLTRWKYMVLDWHPNVLPRISSQVGGGGERIMRQFFSFVKGVHERGLRTMAFTVEQSVVYGLVNGAIYPQFLLCGPHHPYSTIEYAPWDSDLLDIEHQEASRDYYERTYGTEFVLAQDILSGRY